MSDDDKITSLDDRRKRTADVAVITLPPVGPMPVGPFTVTISDASGKIFEVVLPDHRGLLPDGGCIMGTAPFDSRVLVNLLTGAMRAFVGV